MIGFSINRNLLDDKASQVLQALQNANAKIENQETAIYYATSVLLSRKFERTAYEPSRWKPHNEDWYKNIESFEALTEKKPKDLYKLGAFQENIDNCVIQELDLPNLLAGLISLRRDIIIEDGVDFILATFMLIGNEDISTKDNDRLLTKQPREALRRISASNMTKLAEFADQLGGNLFKRAIQFIYELPR